MFFSVVIPTYNRLPILQKCLQAISQQEPGGYDDYEVIVVDDGSTDDTIAWLESAGLERVSWYVQDHRGPAAARNLGVTKSQGDTIVFIDSDLVVVDDFLASHAAVLRQNASDSSSGLAKIFVYGRVINTSNFDDPRAETFKPTDFSAAFFATGNVAIARHWLDEVSETPEGPFDTRFQLYGWEDLELGVRLKNIGIRMVKSPEAAGYHWNPKFTLDRIPYLIDREWQRGRMGVLFYQKHPTWDVRMMIQMTPLHKILWGLLSLGGYLNERRIRPALEWLAARGQPGLALELCRVCFLNWYNVQGVYEAYREWKQTGQLSLPPSPSQRGSAQ